MPIEKLRPTFTFNEDRINELKKIAPEAFADGKINWETLQETLGEYLEDDEAQEHFGLFWPGKRQARRMAAVPSKGTLAPVYGEGLKADGTPDSDGCNDSRNIFIEGENLEVLKILQKSYAGKIKMIYIDPPYNTGNDFVYDDNFTEPLQEYLRRTGQVDEAGQPLTTNKRADGRFHSKWLSMMYPRLRLARNLLQDDGVIFVSIDDNEVLNLRAIMNEIFGEENFNVQIIIQSNKRGQTYKQIAKTHEYLLCFSKNTETEINELEKITDDLIYKDKISQFNIRELRNRNPKFGKFNRPNLFYPIYTTESIRDANKFHAISLQKSEKFNIEILPLNSAGGESCWRWGKELLNKNISNDLNISNVISKKRADGGWNVYEKYRKSTYKAKSIWSEKEVINEQGTIDLKNIGMKGIFDFPKPVELVRKCILLGANKNDIIIDFFGGSATSGHALLESNIKDNSGNKYILVQMPELCDGKSEAYKAGHKTIAEIGKERIRRVVKKIKEEQKKKQDIFPNEKANLDLGFKCFRLEFSNYKEWINYEHTESKRLEDLFDQFKTPLRENWTEQGLLSETMLIEGFPLDSDIERLAHFKANNIRKVTSEFCDHALLVCFDDKIHDATIGQLDLNEKDIFICLDSAIADQEKLRLADKGLIKTI